MTLLAHTSTSHTIDARQIRINGIVQGVGFRPTVWRLANEFGLQGKVLNDGNGVLIHIWGNRLSIDNFIDNLHTHCPPLAKIHHIESEPLQDEIQPDCFEIATSTNNEVRTNVAADAANCAACTEDTLNPFSRRYRYPFTNCTHCGPRFSIVHGIPYDRAQTSMAEFSLCEDCNNEYQNPLDRRFHAQPNACYVCGPKAWLERSDGHTLCTENLTQLDDIDAACSLLQQGKILAIKGIGGFHLACDATNTQAVETLRQRKRRYHKPFALMARDLEIINQYCYTSEQEKALLLSTEAPIVILQAKNNSLPQAIAPQQNTLGFMLPYTPLHHLLLKRMQRPIVLTSGNLSDEPQCIENNAAKKRLGELAEYVLLHNRDIVNRVDDSVVRVMANAPRLLRRARGYAPASIPLPNGFAASPNLLAMGGELKNTFCLIKDGQAILSQHMGDLEDATTFVDYQKNLNLYSKLFQHKPQQIVIDAHPEYLSSKLGEEISNKQALPLQKVQHHHAHIAACLADNNRALNSEPVLGVALDGLGYGETNDEQAQLWGGEFLVADYLQAKQVGTFKPVAMLGGTKAIYEPWRNTYAHLMAELGWQDLKMNFAQLELIRFLESKPLETFNAMLKTGNHSPLVSSCGRLFDAVAAAMGISRESVSYEGQAAIELESLVDTDTLLYEDELLAYPFAIPNLENQIPYIEPLAMWQALLGDLILKTPLGVMSARFHKGLAMIIVTMVKKLTTENEIRTINDIVLSGGVFQNKFLLEQVITRLEKENFNVLTHQQVPANDGGLALGQAAIAAARTIKNYRG